MGGYVGQVSFGHAAMFGLGGFVAARSCCSSQLRPRRWPGSSAAWWRGIFALWRPPHPAAARPLLLIATIGLGEAARLVFTYWDGFTGGASGLSLPIEADRSTGCTGGASCSPALAIAASFVHPALDARPAAPRDQGRRGGGRRRRRERHLLPGSRLRALRRGGGHLRRPLRVVLQLHRAERHVRLRSLDLLRPHVGHRRHRDHLRAGAGRGRLRVPAAVPPRLLPPALPRPVRDRCSS